MRALCILALAVLPCPAVAQLGEVHVGVLVSRGSPDAIGTGGGLIVGVAAGRIIYVGARWSYHASRTRHALTPAPVELHDRFHVFGVDGGVLFPIAGMELVPGVTLGWYRNGQRIDDGTDRVQRSASVRFFGAPSLALHVRVLGLVATPEVQYFLPLEPLVDRPAALGGLVGVFRLVVPIEVNRIRY